ncbi:hypothetical protein T07_12111, partial [Trichinella nelsoni]
LGLLKRLGYFGIRERRLQGCHMDKPRCDMLITQKDHIKSCPVDEHLAYKMEKKAVLKKRSAE